MQNARAFSSLQVSTIFAGHLLRRKPGAELWLFLLCQVFAVAVVCGTLLFTDRIERAIYTENAKLMAADMLVESSRPIPAGELGGWQRYAEVLALQSVRAVELDSMLYFDGALQLTEIKAVGRGYPLRGELTAAAQPGLAPQLVAALPGRGEIWLDTRTAQALAASPGDRIELGAASLTFTRVLHSEPGLVLPALGLAGRALIALEQLDASGLLMPGSRATYRWMLAGDTANISLMARWLEPKLGPHQRLLSSQRGSERTARVIERAQGFLNLSGAAALMLALIATLITAYKYLEQEQQVVAIWKALGFQSGSLGRAYALLFSVWWLVASLLGCALGVLLQAVTFYFMRHWIEVDSAYAWQPFLLAVFTALLCLLCFAVPILRGLNKVSPMRLLRNSASLPLSPLAMWWLLPAFAILLNAFSRSWSATLWLVAGLVALAAASWWLVWAVVMLLQKGLKLYQRQGIAGVAAGADSATPVMWLGLHAFSRQRRPSQVRITALAMTLAMLVVIVGLRGGLLGAWQAQIPASAPNYFAVNISPGDRAAWQQRLEGAGVRSQGLFPVARARLVAINGETVAVRRAASTGASTGDSTGEQRALRREMVMTQAGNLPLGNTIERGRWHDAANWQQAGSHASEAGSGQHDEAGSVQDSEQNSSARKTYRGGARVSVEQSIAAQLGIRIGDTLRFNFASQALDVEVGSIRALNWNSMQPNFYFILSPPLLEAYPYTYMTSFYLPDSTLPAGTDFLLALGREFPAVALIDIGQLIAQLKSVLDRVGLAVQALAAITVLAALLVLVASLRASLDQRLHEQSILRALGGRAVDLRRIALVELGLSGLIAGLVGCGSGALLVWLLGEQLFDLPVALDAGAGLAILLGSIALVMWAGMLVLGRVYRVSPMLAWRRS